jgi:DNA polymerase-3 subunit delta
MKTKHEGIGVLELRGRLAAGSIAPIYLIVGEEAWLREQALAAIKAAALGPEDAGVGVFNQDLVYGDETDARELLGLCETLPVFAERRLVVVRDVGALRAKETERLLPYLQAPVETTSLVLTGEKVDGRVKFFQALKAAAVTVDCSPLDARSVPAWLQEQAQSLGLRLDDAACEALLEASSNNLSVMRRELEKLAAYLLPKTAVAVADIEAVRGADTGGTVWDLLEALGRKDRTKALRALAKVVDAGEPPLRLLGLLAAHWRQVWKAKEQLARRVPEAGLARVLGVPPFRIRGLVQQARVYSDEDLARSFGLFRAADSQLKGEGRGNEKRALESLVLALCRESSRPTSQRAFAPAR